jgi:hypothetical protein
MATNPTMDFSQQLSPLFDWDTLLEYLGEASLVQLSIDDYEGLDVARESSGLSLVYGECITDEVIEIQGSLVNLRVGHNY